MWNRHGVISMDQLSSVPVLAFRVSWISRVQTPFASTAFEQAEVADRPERAGDRYPEPELTGVDAESSRVVLVRSVPPRLPNKLDHEAIGPAQANLQIRETLMREIQCHVQVRDRERLVHRDLRRDGSLIGKCQGRRIGET